MRWRPWLAAALVLASCGDDVADLAEVADPTAAARASNLAPRVESAEITPGAPAVGDTLTLESSVQDPEDDPVELSYEWFVNRELQATSGDVFETERLKRGDEIYALVRASDGALENVGQTVAIRLGNSPPRVTGVTVLPAQPDASQTLIAQATVQDRDGDTYKLRFEWSANGKPLANADGATLEPGRVKRGDTVRVSVSASDADSGPSLASQPITIANARPQITSTPSTELSDKEHYEYQISAQDPDGDRPLRYTLVSGPDGMSVDLVSGLVEWDLPSEADGKFDVEVSVRDAHGAEARQSYALEFHWEVVPAKKSKPAPASDDD